MSVSRIASRYAKSLIDLASEEGKLDRVLEDIKTLKNAAANRDLYLLFKSPIINTAKKSQILETLFGDKFDKMTMGFIRIILGKAREAYLPEIANEFLLQYKSLQHISTIKVTTATQLSDDAVAKIKAKLLESAATEENVEIETAVNPDILGGMIIEFDDKRYDASVAHQLAKMKKEFSKNLFVKDF